VIDDGELQGLLERGGRSVLLFGSASEDPEGVAGAIADAAKGASRRLTVERVDGGPISTSRLAGALLDYGFVIGYKGLTYRGPARPARD
jgi:hypothetical protein